MFSKGKNLVKAGLRPVRPRLDHQARIQFWGVLHVSLFLHFCNATNKGIQLTSFGPKKRYVTDKGIQLTLIDV